MATKAASSSTGAIARRALAVLLLLISALLLVGGVELARLGGSLYYLIAGLTLLAAGILVWRGNARGAIVYAIFLLVTIVWAYWEAGFDGWALAPRLIAPGVLGLIFALPPVRRGLGSRAALAPAGAGLLGLMLVAVAALSPTFTPGIARAALTIAFAEAPGEWPHYGRTLGGDRFSPLAQITPANVDQLEVAWTYHTGVVQGGVKSPLQATPIMVGDSLYLCSQTNILIALDAETGRERWRFDPKIDATGVSVVTTCRGVAFYRAPGAPDCPERIIGATFDGRLIAVDARTGRLCPSFGEGGTVDLRRGMGRVDPGFYYVSSAPTIVRGRIIVGGWVADNQSTDEPSGVIRAFDAVTGRLSWAWDSGRPNQRGEPVEGQTYTRSSPNSWAPMSGDEQLGLVYVPTGNPTPDHWGGQRSAESERYGSAIVAIDAETGQPRWSFQTTHHDLWDYDVASQPTLLDLPLGNGSGSVPALLQATKRGELFLLDRRTGAALASIEERRVPQRGAVAGERLSPTQPFSVGMPSVAGPPLTEHDMWGISPLDQLWCRIGFRKLRYDGPMTPPGEDASLIYPSIGGGVNWGSVTIDPARKLLLVNAMYYPTVIKLVPRAETDRLLAEAKAGYSHNFALPQPQAGAPYGALLTGLLSPLATPCNEPPYGKMFAIDLVTRKIVWERPIGSSRDTGPFNIPSLLPLGMGMPNFGGSLATASGLAFIGATQDTSFRAFDSATGRQMWQRRLPAGGQSNPMTYLSPTSGRQFVVIAAGGHVLSQSKLGDAIVAYALPKRR